MSRLGLSFRYHPTPVRSSACNAQFSYNPRSYDFSKSRDPAFWDIGPLRHIIGMYGPPQNCKRKLEMTDLVCTNVFGLSGVSDSGP